MLWEQYSKTWSGGYDNRRPRDAGISMDDGALGWQRVSSRGWCWSLTYLEVRCTYLTPHSQPRVCHFYHVAIGHGVTAKAFPFQRLMHAGMCKSWLVDTSSAVCLAFCALDLYTSYGPIIHLVVFSGLQDRLRVRSLSDPELLTTPAF
jgi:hypothetical protein